MATFPGAIPPAGSAVSTDTLAAAGHTALHNTSYDEARAIATKIGTGASTPTSGMLLRGNGVGTSAWAQANLTSDVTGTLPQANGGTGTTSATGTGATVYQTSPTITTPTITTPTITDFTGSQHNHTNAAGGGKITSSAITSLDLSLTTLSNPYKFSAYRAAAANTGNGAFAQIVYDTELFDTNNNFAAGTYTAPINGFYHFEAGLNAAGTTTIISIFKNGSEHKRGGQGSSTGVQVCALVQLSVGDTIDARAFGNVANALDVSSAALNYFSGYLISTT